METNSKEYMVHYNGWSNKWNELVPANRIKIGNDNITLGSNETSEIGSTESKPILTHGQGPVLNKTSQKQSKSSVQRFLRQSFVFYGYSLIM